MRKARKSLQPHRASLVPRGAALAHVSAPGLIRVPMCAVLGYLLCGFPLDGITEAICLRGENSDDVLYSPVAHTAREDRTPPRPQRIRDAERITAIPMCSPCTRQIGYQAFLISDLLDFPWHLAHVHGKAIDHDHPCQRVVLHLAWTVPLWVHLPHI